MGNGVYPFPSLIKRRGSVFLFGILALRRRALETRRARPSHDERISRISGRVSRRVNMLSLNIHITRRERTELMVENDEWRGALRNGKLKFLGHPPSFVALTAGGCVRRTGVDRACSVIPLVSLRSFGTCRKCHLTSWFERKQSSQEK